MQNYTKADEHQSAAVIFVWLCWKMSLGSIISFCMCKLHPCLHSCIVFELVYPRIFSIWYMWNPYRYSHISLFVSLKPRQAGSSYLHWGVKGSVSNIHGCEAIKELVWLQRDDQCKDLQCNNINFVLNIRERLGEKNPVWSFVFQMIVLAT